MEFQTRLKQFYEHSVTFLVLVIALGPLSCLAQYEALAPVALPNRDTCNRAAFQTVLHPELSHGNQHDARAVWLNRQLVKWPGAYGSGVFRLYYSEQGRMVAFPNARVEWADGWLSLDNFAGSVPPEIATRFKYVADGPVLALRESDLDKLPGLHRQQLLLVKENGSGQIQDVTAIQVAGALDDLFTAAANVANLGVSIARDTTHFRVWAPTTSRVSLCVYRTGASKALQVAGMHGDPRTGIWSLGLPTDLSGKYYTYIVDVFVPGIGLVRNRVTDPYSISLSADSKRSYIANLESARLKPSGWEATVSHERVTVPTDMVIYELHVRDFSINDQTVPAAHRGKYTAFAQNASIGMKHLKALAKAGVTDIHLLPVFDFASVPEAGCVTPRIDAAHLTPDGEAQQATVMATADRDCFNWGYDPLHYTAPEGSYATDPAHGGRRIVEFRQMVMALHRANLRVGMDVVYNHTSASGQHARSVLDRIVPGYYHRLNANGAIEKSTCCENTATENLMMAKLMLDSVTTWARAYKLDSFRFDLMGHQPRAVMEQLKARLLTATGRDIQLIGEGWNFGEVADGARFVQASQLSLNGSGIGTFSDRARDAVRGGGAADSGDSMIKRQGYINGLGYDPNALAGTKAEAAELPRTADLVRVGLAGSLRDYPLFTHRDERLPLHRIDYNGQPAGYASQPAEVVNYVENHDNQTLFDINAYKLPPGTSREDRSRVQLLGLAIVAFSQGIAYFHAGGDILRSKSMDRNSFDSGDWFNRLDWSCHDNYFGAGAPPKNNNGAEYGLIKPLLANPGIKPTAREIAWARDAFLDLLRIRASSTLFRLSSSSEIISRLTFHNTGSHQISTMLAVHLNGEGYPGARFRELFYLINVDKVPRVLAVPSMRGKAFTLHPVHQSPGAADRRVAAAARFESSEGAFRVPARSAVVFVVR
jgi:pullulanase-type alpha-1,6-glucosidase